MVYNPKLVQFETKDSLLLPGLLFEPKSKTKKALIYLHGNGSASIFYSVDKMNVLAQELNKAGIAFFPFNNRGAQYIHKIKTTDNKDGVKQGTALELIKDCVLDINGAIEFLKKQGYSEFYLVGSSTGANKIALYHYLQPKNPVKKYILLSGGDDVGLTYDMLGREQFYSLFHKCKEEIKKGMGQKLIPQIIDSDLYSYQSLYDTINPDGNYNIFPYKEVLENLKLSKKPLFAEFKTINKPTLVVYGEKDEYCYGKVRECVRILKKECSHPEKFEFKIVKGADHGFTGYEKELAKTISSYLLFTSSK